MSAPGSSDKITKYTVQYMQNYGFDDVYKEPTVEIVGPDSDGNLRRATVTSNGAVLTETAPPSLQKRFEFDDNGTLSYIGVAAAGVAESTESWTISHWIFDGGGNPSSKQLAVGSWDDRTSLTYT